jgi:hypothetical protein
MALIELIELRIPATWVSILWYIPRAGTLVQPSVYSSDSGIESASSFVSDVDRYVIIIKLYIVFSTYF